MRNEKTENLYSIHGNKKQEMKNMDLFKAF